MVHAACCADQDCENAVALLCDTLWGYRVAEGHDMKTICRRVHDKALTLQGPELNALMAWMWQFSLHVTYLLSQVLSLFSCCPILLAAFGSCNRQLHLLFFLRLFQPHVAGLFLLADCSLSKSLSPGCLLLLSLPY